MPPDALSEERVLAPLKTCRGFIRSSYPDNNQPQARSGLTERCPYFLHQNWALLLALQWSKLRRSSYASRRHTISALFGRTDNQLKE